MSCGRVVPKWPVPSTYHCTGGKSGLYRLGGNCPGAGYAYIGCLGKPKT